MGLPRDVVLPPPRLLGPPRLLLRRERERVSPAAGRVRARHQDPAPRGFSTGPARRRGELLRGSGYGPRCFRERLAQGGPRGRMSRDAPGRRSDVARGGRGRDGVLRARAYYEPCAGGRAAVLPARRGCLGRVAGGDVGRSAGKAHVPAHHGGLPGCAAACPGGAARAAAAHGEHQDGRPIPHRPRRQLGQPSGPLRRGFGLGGRCD
mmetsp:Transcript_9613/g.23400  ORF Transcript_9613/g.23400 Transcript_9613/m.23400 type:complete len:207 (+) Transcript_9613:2768-3388(+)